ncbi:2-hydroxymuconate tautomerase [Phycicoccus avicenniae]|uniref:2-hydroxymuconate tautomerase n=1 Tax=Phycicoccus avicenniae TaxID=2828860 RepID=UPI003D2DF485
MPVVDVTLAQGRTPEQLRTLVTALTDAVVEAVGAPRESVRVILREVPPTHFAAGDVTIAERRSRTEEEPS